MDVMTDIALRSLRPDAVPTRRFESRPNAALAAAALGVPVLDVVVPVYNEQAALADSVHRLHRHLRDTFPYPVRITIADNASIDDTPRIAAELAARARRGPGGASRAEGPRPRAARRCGRSPTPPVLAYMDVDLSTDLAALAPLVAPLISGHSDLAIGTRLGRGSRVVRGAKREIISRCYNLILRSTLAARFSDAQCGFKAIRADVARAAAAARRRHRMVLRHRTAGARRTQRVAHPRGAGRLGRRPRQPGRHRRHRHRRSQGRGSPAARLRQRLHPGERDCRPTGFVARVRPRRARCSVRWCGSARSVSRRLRPISCCSC